MKKVLCLLTVALLLVQTLALGALADTVDSDNVTQEAAIDIKNTVVTDSLPQIDTVKWYKFTLEDTADVAVEFLTEYAGDLYACWKVTLFRASDGKWLREKDTGKGTAKDNYLLKEDLEPGEYYVSVGSMHHEDPGTPEEYYSDMPYTIRVITEGYIPPTGDAQRLTVSAAGEIIAVIGGNVYIKHYDGEAFVAGCVTDGSDGAESGLILISEDADAVEYYTPKVTDRMWSHVKEVEFQGKIYYYTGVIRDGYEGIASDPTLYLCCDGQRVSVEDAVNDLLKLHLGTSPGEIQEEEEQKQEAKDQVTFWIIAAVFAVAVIVGIVWYFKSRKKVEDYFASAGRSSGYDGYTEDIGRTPTDQDMRDLADMDIAKGIARNARTPGYEADGPATGSGPEDFPPSGSVW